MNAENRRRAQESKPLSIGVLSRATGIPAETLRTWERRYGFPLPDRKPSGHRLYPAATVKHLRRVARLQLSAQGDRIKFKHRGREYFRMHSHRKNTFLYC